MSALDDFLRDCVADCVGPEQPLIERLRTSNGPGGIRRADVLELCEEVERLQRENQQMREALAELVAEADEHPGWDGHTFSSTVGFSMARTALERVK